MRVQLRPTCCTPEGSLPGYFTVTLTSGQGALYRLFLHHPNFPSGGTVWAVSPIIPTSRQGLTTDTQLPASEKIKSGFAAIAANPKVSSSHGTMVTLSLK